MAEPSERSGISLWGCLVLAAMGAYTALAVALSMRFDWRVGLAMAVLWFAAGAVAARRGRQTPPER